MQDLYIGDVGKGFPLVLVHGFLGSSIIWGPQIKFFRKFYRVITPDLPGFGKSNKVKSLNSIKLISNLLLESLKKKNINKFHLLGHSMGGMIVQEIAKISGHRINKLICFATGPIGDIPGRFEPINTSIEKLKIEGIKEQVKRIPKNWFVKGDKAKNYYLCENAVKHISEETALNALIAMRDWNGLDNLKNINNKTLIIWGDKDKSYNFEQISLLKSNIPDSDIKIFKNCCHNVHLEKPEEFSEVVSDFLIN